MRVNVLVIDDKYQERRPGYERLRASCERFAGFRIQFEYLEHPNNLRQKLRGGKFHALILDAVLHEEPGWETFTIDAVLQDAGSEIPIALLSGQWDETNSLQINAAWKAPNCKTFLHWRDISPDGNGQIDFAVRPLLRMITDAEALDSSVRLGDEDPVWILHLSDIQIGGFDEKNLQLEAKRSADLILEKTDSVQPTFVSLTGDVAEHGVIPQYERAKNWLGYFLARLGCGGLPFERLLHVPGNHDVNLALSGAARLGPVEDDGKLVLRLDDKLLQPDLRSYAYSPFRRFEEQVCGRHFLSPDPYDQNLAWVESKYRHLGVVFYGVNTARPVNAFGLPDRSVDPSALAEISVELQKVYEQSDRPLIVGLSHHAPVPVLGDPEGSVTNPDAFENIFRAKPRTGLFMHGHTHKQDLLYTNDGKYRLVRSAAATLTKEERARPKDTLRGFNLLELRRSAGAVVGLAATSYGWLSSDLLPVKTASWDRHADGLFTEVLPNKGRRRKKG